MKLKINNIFNITDVKNKKISLDFIDIFSQIEDIGDNELPSVFKKLVFHIINSDKRVILSFIYSNSAELNKFVFFWLLCDYLFYRECLKINHNFVKYFLISDKYPLVAILLLLKEMKKI